MTREDEAACYFDALLVAILLDDSDACLERAYRLADLYGNEDDDVTVLAGLMPLVEEEQGADLMKKFSFWLHAVTGPIKIVQALARAGLHVGRDHFLVSKSLWKMQCDLAVPIEFVLTPLPPMPAPRYARTKRGHPTPEMAWRDRLDPGPDEAPGPGFQIIEVCIDSQKDRRRVWGRFLPKPSSW